MQWRKSALRLLPKRGGDDLRGLGSMMRSRTRDRDAVRPAEMTVNQRLFLKRMHFYCVLARD